jgi:lipoprotein-releasing system permease protein
MAPSNQSFRVVGVYRSGFYEYDNKLVMVDYRALQDFFHQGDVVTGLEIRVDDVFGTGDISQEIKHRLPPGRFRTLDWREINRNLFASLKLQEIALSIILIFIIVVASFNIVCTLIMLVLEKSKDIAILKSMGASNGGVMRVFIVQGMTIGTIGTALGLLVGFLTCWGLGSVDFGLDAKVYLIDRLPVKMQLWQFGAVALVSLLISFTATLYPSWYAARLPPVEGLRYD